jgi:hypothetical protein
MQSNIEDKIFLGFDYGLSISTEEEDESDKLSIDDGSFILPDDIGDTDDAYKKSGTLFIGKEGINNKITHVEVWGIQ